jgi:Na+-transporting NADH:ubiquinone oxidoreductase subunit C
LGAEIKGTGFTNQFKGKKILDSSGELVSIDVRKGDASTDYQVDGISGGTITSDAVEVMILDWLEAYIPFLKENAGQNASAQNF